MRDWKHLFHNFESREDIDQRLNPGSAVTGLPSGGAGVFLHLHSVHCLSQVWSYNYSNPQQVPDYSSSWVPVLEWQLKVHIGVASQPLFPAKQPAIMGTMSRQIRTLANRMGSVIWPNWPDWQLAQNLNPQLKISHYPLEMGFRGCFFSVHSKSVAFQINKSPTGGYWEVPTFLSFIASCQSNFHPWG